MARSLCFFHLAYVALPSGDFSHNYINVQPCQIGRPTQQWDFKNGQIVQRANPDRCIHALSTANLVDGIVLELNDCWGTSALSEQFTYNAETQVIAWRDGKVVDCSNGCGGGSGSLAWLWRALGSENQRWHWDEASGLLKSMTTSYYQGQLCMDSSMPQPVPWGNDVWPSVGAIGPTQFGFVEDDLWNATNFINENVIQRECLLFAKDGRVVFELYGNGAGVATIFEGYSMTKSVGAHLVLYAASEGKLDLDVDITKEYGVPSPKEYAVSTRLILSQIIADDDAPGKMWEYDSLGNMWLDYLPKILLAATGKDAAEWFAEYKFRLELSDDFTWETANSEWHTGAKGPCRDWARLGQVIASGGRWGNVQVLQPQIAHKFGEPVKHEPFNYYANPCWGHGFWTNANKTKYPGCCWEASRLPAPMCNEATFIDGAVDDLVLMLGLYGQVVMALPSENAVVVSLGKDFRPLEPVRQGVYPAFCKVLGLPCSQPEEVPVPRCGETLECLGVSAQCYGGFTPFSHEKPTPQGQSCVECVMERVVIWNSNPEEELVLRNYCAIGDSDDEEKDVGKALHMRRLQSGISQLQSSASTFDHAMSGKGGIPSPAAMTEFLECFCNDGDNPFVWPDTTTTTPAPDDVPYPPKIYTTTTGPAHQECSVPADCIAALELSCGPRGGQDSCYECLHNWWGDNADKHGCHQEDDFGTATLEFCFCGTLRPNPDTCYSEIVTIRNEYSQPVTLAAPQPDSRRRVTVNAGGHLLNSNIELPLVSTFAERLQKNVHVSSPDGVVDSRLFVNWTYRAIQGYKLAATPAAGDCPTWGGSSARLQNKRPWDVGHVDGCQDESCCQQACCESTDFICDTWALYSGGSSGCDLGCYIGRSSHFTNETGWVANTVSRSAYSDGDYRFEISDQKPNSGFFYIDQCKDPECCQDYCGNMGLADDGNSGCSAWAWDPSRNECWTGIEKHGWQQFYGWIGRTGRSSQGGPIEHLSSTCNKFDGHYSLTVKASGALSLAKIEQPDSIELL